jgi:Fe-S cluster assembly protein SufD
MATITKPAADPHRWLAEFEEFERGLPAGEPASLKDLRRQGIERFAALGFPTIRMEEWRFTNVAPVARLPLRLSRSVNGVGPEEFERYRYEGSAAVAFVNGRFRPEFSDLEGLPAGVVVSGLAAAIESQPEIVEPYLGHSAKFDEQAFVALNTAFLNDGALIHVPRGVVVEKPIHLMMMASPGAEPMAFFPRNLIVAEENSQVTVVEHYVTAGRGAYLSSPVTELVAQANAVVDHYKLQRESREAFHLATFQLRQERDSNVSSHSISWGGALVRNDVNALLDGEGCEATLNGLYMVEGNQLVDNHMRVEHAKPHCDSHELYKGILEGKARAVFNGRIYVHPGAQKTDAKQTNRNLLLSPDALCNSNPQLEIFADDVRCTHGSTVGQLDPTAVFYLRSRGIGDEAARSLLTYAFAADIVERIRVGSVRRDLEEFLFRRLPKGDIVRQAV